jgi:hypothetical protein
MKIIDPRPYRWTRDESPLAVPGATFAVADVLP